MRNMRNTCCFVLISLWIGTSHSTASDVLEGFPDASTAAGWSGAGNDQRLAARQQFRTPVSQNRRTSSRAMSGNGSTRKSEITRQEDAALAEEEKSTLRRALDYLARNPQKISDYIETDDFQSLRQAVNEGSLERWLANYPQPTFRMDGREIMLDSSYVALLELGDQLLAQEDPGQMVKLYARVFRMVDERERRRFPRPGAFSRLSAEESRSTLRRIMRLVRSGSDNGGGDNGDGSSRPPVQWAASCAQEIGASSSLSDGAARCADNEYHANSIFWNSSFPLKYKHTCIKQQGRRGTCVAFSINSLMESHLLIASENRYNFSQQKTFFKAKKERSGFTRYRDGLRTRRALEDLADKDYAFQYESVWEYNPSYHRKPRDGDYWPDSCQGYTGQMCTDFSFQAIEEKNCAGRFCWREYEFPAGNSQANFTIDDVVSLTFPNISRSLSLNVAIAHLNEGEPLIFRYKTRKNFHAAGADGIVRPSGDTSKTGYHASLVIGFVANDDLPDGVPDGAGGGYFIVKNSWGIRSGDCGYFYASYEYMQDNMRGIFAIEI